MVRILRDIKRAPYKGHLDSVGYTNVNWEGSPFDRQNVVARSSAEAEYRAMALTAREFMWLKPLFKSYTL